MLVFAMSAEGGIGSIGFATSTYVLSLHFVPSKIYNNNIICKTYFLYKVALFIKEILHNTITWAWCSILQNYVLIFNKHRIQELVNYVRLVRVSSPAGHGIEVFSLKGSPRALLNHELPGHFIPSLLPIQPSIQYHNVYIVDTHVAPDQGEPAPIGHRP